MISEHDVRRTVLEPETALDVVRRATAESHRRLESLTTQVRLMSDDYTIEEYRHGLERLFGFYVPLTEALAAGGHGIEWAARLGERAELLRQDLFDLGITEHEPAHCAARALLPQLDTPDRALGCAYVLEGSTLGGQVICRHLTRVFQVHLDVPLRFFTGDGDSTGSHWRQFCRTLNTQATNVEEVCAAARATFDALGTWLAS